MSTKIKICGIKNEYEMNHVIDAKVDYIGFVFTSSKRQVNLQDAKKLSRLIPSNIQKVGVFTSPSIEDVKNAILEVGIDIVQLHGDLELNLIESISIPVIYAYNIATGINYSDMKNIKADWLLFDAAKPGSGETFNWKELKTEMVPKPYFIAGGLAPCNVNDAIECFSPYGVDVSSGVETEGQKDPFKIRAFVEKVRYGR